MQNVHRSDEKEKEEFKMDIIKSIEHEQLKNKTVEYNIVPILTMLSITVALK